MPTKPPHQCNRPGCYELTTSYYCPDHETERRERRARSQERAKRKYDASRPSAKQRGYTSREHRRWRRAVLSKDPYCVDPLGLHDTYKESRPPSVHAHHIIPVKHGGQWVTSNGAGLCKLCHDRVTAIEKRNVQKAIALFS